MAGSRSRGTARSTKSRCLPLRVRSTVAASSTSPRELRLERVAIRPAVRGEHDLGTARAEAARRLLADLARADQEDAPALERAEHLLRERGGRRRDRCRALADRRLRAHLAAGVEGLP